MRLFVLCAWMIGALSLSACGDKSTEICDDGLDNDENGSIDCGDESCVEEAICDDADGDGFLALDDCDDSDAQAYPGNAEVCDAVDNDCNGIVDDEPTDGTIYYGDSDSDGYGDINTLVNACELTDGIVDNADDCDDENDAINPDADEVCDEVDNNCDNVVDSDAVDLNTYYADADGDGYGNDEISAESCSIPNNYAEAGGDCDDSNALMNPGADEICDEYDNDCSGEINDNATDGTTYYTDSDGDSYGDPDNPYIACEPQPGYVLDNTDCDDASDTSHPNAPEICDEGLDNDCNGLADDDDSNLQSASTENWYEDADGDGYGAEDSVPVEACSAPVGTSGNLHVSNDDDCDDVDITVYLGAPEVCDGLDNDCDGQEDDKPSNASVYYIDADGDGYGDDSTPVISCSDPSTATESYVLVSGDCDDTVASINPGATDVCDGVDDNCSGDESDASGATVFYADIDGDGYGDASNFVSSCEAPSGYVADDTDCDDGEATVYPSAEEICDLQDNDCDGDIDQADSGFDPAQLITFYSDADGDGYGDSSVTVQDCTAPTGYVALDGDCDDDATDADNDGVADGFDTNPSIIETYYDGVDSNCDGMDDFDQDGDGDAISEYDCDGDGITETSCDIDGDGVDDYIAGTDCDDTDATQNDVDGDGDGFSSCAGDCDDSASDDDGDGVADGFYTYPGAAFNQSSTDCLTDRDGDGYAAVEYLGCFDFEVTDTYGDGWNGNQIDIYENGTLTTSIANQNLDGISYNGGTGETQTVAFCTAASTTSLEFVFVDGSYNTEVQFTITDSTGNLVGVGQGSGTYDLVFEGVTYTDGDTFYADSGTTGQDCDDTDASIAAVDADADGSIDCAGDCDPTDASLNNLDVDGDGYSTCQDDCDDANPRANPGETEVYYDGLDANCDGMDDYDQDGDGEIASTAGTCDDSQYTNQTDCENSGVCDDSQYTTEADCISNGTCDDPQYTTEVDCITASQNWTTNTWTPIGNVWTSLGGTDCDDLNASIYAAADEVCDGVDNDCDGDADDADVDIDPSFQTTFYEDQDGDGYGTDSSALSACTPPSGYTPNGGDCNDDPNNNGTAQNPGIAEVYYDGVDANCDGLDDFDQDGDGELPSELDCDGDGVTETSCDIDGDGVNDYVAGTDCDDTSSALSSADADGDGYSTCDGDCNDSISDEDGDSVPDGFYTYPGAAYNESSTDCLTDMDGDGYGGLATFGCFDFEVTDTYGDSWNGNQIDIYENGTLTTSIANQNLDGISYNGAAGETQNVAFCPDGATTDLAFVFVDGSWNSEVLFTIYDSAGNVIGSGQGSGSVDLIFEGVTYTDGDTFYTDVVTNGQDCDDTDATIGAVDLDGDGSLGCDDDCDDNDPLVGGNQVESCSDGLDNDCDGLTDCDDSDCETTCFEVVCDDGIDGDGDGDLDCADSDCVDDDACLELICDDGIDDDGDGDMDCDDSDCLTDLYCELECVDTNTNDLGSTTGVAVVTGSNAGELDDFSGSCTQGLGGEDVTYLWTAPTAGTYTFSTTGSTYDTVLYILDNCVGDELDCNDDVDFATGDTTSTVEDLFVGEGDSVVIIIDSYEVFETGTYSLDITPTFEPDCSDGLDDDGDGDIDCADSDCIYDAACALSTCPNWDLGTVTGNGLMSGSLSGATSDQVQASCSSQGGNDFVIAWEAPDSGCVNIDTLSGTMDTILTLFDACPSSGGTELACNDDSASFVYESELEYDVVSGSTYYIGLDAWSSSIYFTYVLDINLSVGTSCN